MDKRFETWQIWLFELLYYVIGVPQVVQVVRPFLMPRVGHAPCLTITLANDPFAMLKSNLYLADSLHTTAFFPFCL